ncbi:MAG: PilW family protein [Planctomycetota bacterium]|jgi:prepilin-type N-terminal cleavage/methylation domain-containing protein
MKRETVGDRHGFTMIELLVTMGLAAIVILAMGITLADNQKGWRRMYDRVYSDVVTDAYVTRMTFDRIARQSTIRRQLIDGDPYAVTGNVSLMVYYYDDPLTSPELDKYATFRIAGTDLLVDYGDLNPGTWDPEGSPRTVTLARDVESVTFSTAGVAVWMALTLDNDKERMTITTSAYRYNGHNEQ